MAYRPPQLSIYQDFQAPLAPGVSPLYACYIGSKYALHRFSVTAEQALLGAYDAIMGLSGAWPDHVAGGVVETVTAKVYLKDTLLRYFSDTAVGYLTLADGNKVRTVGYSELIFKSNNYADRSTVFGTRDVRAGDIVDLAWIDATVAKTLRTKVASLEAEVIPGTTEPVPVRVTGFGSTVGAASGTTPPTRLTCWYSQLGSVADPVLADYNGLPAGFPSDTYTITVSKSVLGGGTGLLDGTVLELVSSDGSDHVTVTLSAANWSAGNARYEFSPGSRGGAMAVRSTGVGTLPLGASWTLTIAQDYTEVNVANPSEFDVLGTYVGLRNTQYQMTITQGGVLGVDELRATVRTTNGADNETVLIVPAAGPFTYPVGLHGLSVVFVPTAGSSASSASSSVPSGNRAFNTGDVVAFDVLAASEGAYKTLVLQDSAPGLLDAVMDVSLYVQETDQVTDTYLTLTDSLVTIAGGVEVSSTLLGVAADYPVIEGYAYVDYRERETVGANVLGFLGSEDDADDLVGPDSPLNPMGKACRLGLGAADGQGVYYFQVATEDLTGYEDALDILTETNVIHGLVPLTTDEDVKTAFKDHVLEYSDEVNCQWRVAWLGNDTPKIYPIYTETGAGADVLAVVDAVVPGQYRRVTVASGLFLTNGVLAGDLLRINFATLPDGTIVYDTYTVDSVTSETALMLSTSLPAAISVPVPIEIWRNLNKSQYAIKLGEYPAKFDTRRVRAVWADNPVEADGTTESMFYVAAALAGQRSGVAPHAPLSQTTVPGILLDPLVQFGRNDMNVIATGGNWIVTKDHTGRVFTRHQLTTCQNPDDLNQREDSKTSNLDEISRDFRDTFQSVVGQSNISPTMLTQLTMRFTALIDAIRARPYPDFLGPQMLDAKLLKLEVDPVLKDTVNVEIDPDMPYPLNGLTIRFKVSA